jgi:hypothetical protein
VAKDMLDGERAGHGLGSVGAAGMRKQILQGHVQLGLQGGRCQEVSCVDCQPSAVPLASREFVVCQ